MTGTKYDGPEGPADLLEDAADRLEKEGWTKGALIRNTYDPVSAMINGRAYCAVGALVYTLDEALPWMDGVFIEQNATPALTTALQALRSVIPGHYVGSDFGVIESWNDDDEDEGTTKQDVLDAFRKAAKEVRP